MSITYRPRLTVDFEKLMAQMLAYPGLVVKPRVDIDSLDDLPLLSYRGLNGASVRNGYPGAGSDWTLLLTLYTDRLDGDLCDTVYQNVHDMEGLGVAGVGAVVAVEDNAMFDRVGGASFADKRIVQYDASFAVTVEPVS